MIGSIAFDQAGRLLVMEIDTAGILDPAAAGPGLPAPGAIVDQRDGTRTALASAGLEFPLGIAVARDGSGVHVQLRSHPGHRARPGHQRPDRPGLRPESGRPAGRQSGRLSAGGLGRWHLHVRRRRLLRIDGRHPPQSAGGGPRVESGRARVLAGGLRRRHLQLRNVKPYGCRSSKVVRGLLAQVIHNRTCLASFLKPASCPSILSMAFSYALSNAFNPFGRFFNVRLIAFCLVSLLSESKWSWARRNLSEY